MLNPIAQELTQHIDTTYSKHLVTPETMYIVAARDEIERLDSAIEACHQEVERLYKMINQIREAPLRIVHGE